MQSKKRSLTEGVVNVIVGYVVAVASQMAIFPLFGIDVSLSSNLLIGVWFASISLGRSYLIRRWFNKKDTVVRL